MNTAQSDAQQQRASQHGMLQPAGIRVAVPDEASGGCQLLLSDGRCHVVFGCTGCS